MVFEKSENANIIYTRITKETLPDALEVIKTAFIPYESICSLLKIDQNPKAVSEIVELSRIAAQDGLSVVALDRSNNNEVVAVAFNKLHKKVEENEMFYERFMKEKCTQPESKALLKFMIEADQLCDIFEHCQINCFLELMFMATKKSHWKKGIGSKLCEVSINLTKSVINEQRILSPSITNGHKTDCELIPEAIVAIFTTFKTQKIGKKMGFDRIKEEPFENFSFYKDSLLGKFDGATLAITLEVLKL